MQNPRLLNSFPSTRQDVLSEALSAHRRALQLEPDNADALFNTAQLLCFMVEDEDDGDWKRTVSDGNSVQPADRVPLIQEAVLLFERCLSTQEAAYQRTTHRSASQQAPDVHQSATAENSLPPPPSEPHSEERDTWAAIEEPITISALIDTGVALLQAITTLCSMNPSSDLNRLDDIMSTSEDLLQVRLSRWLLLAPIEVKSDYTLAEANLKAALLEAQYRAGRISHAAYNKSLTDSFRFVTIQSDNVSSNSTSHKIPLKSSDP